MPGSQPTWGNLEIDWGVTAAFTCAMAASVAAGRFGRGIPDRVLERSFAILVLVIAVFVAVQALLS